MSDHHIGRGHHSHERHHHSEHLSHEETAQQAAHETALRLLAESRHLHVPAGGGPFQAIKHELPNGGDLGPATLAHMINQETGKTSYRTGESLPIPNVAVEGTTAPSPVKHQEHHAAGDPNGPYGAKTSALLNAKLNALLARDGYHPEKL